MALAQQYLQVEKEHYTEDEYFEFEQTAFGRWEFVGGKIRPSAGGEIRAMTGGSDDHGVIASNIVRILGNSAVPKVRVRRESPHWRRHQYVPRCRGDLW